MRDGQGWACVGGLGTGLRDVSVLCVQEGEAEAEEAVEEEPRLSAWRCVLSTSSQMLCV